MSETPAQVIPQENQEQNGVEKRIAELTAQRYAEQDRANQLQAQLMEAAQREAEMARQLAQTQMQSQPKPAPVDPLAAYADHVDPKVLDAMRAQQAAMQRQLEQQFAARQTAMELQTGVVQLRNIATQTQGLPPEVVQRAEQLFTQWRNAGWTQPSVQDAVHIALGQYQMGQLTRAQPVLRQPPQGKLPDTIPGYQPAPVARQPVAARPANFESLSRAEQNAILEKDDTILGSF